MSPNEEGFINPNTLSLLISKGSGSQYDRWEVIRCGYITLQTIAAKLPHGSLYIIMHATEHTEP